ncbi:MAG: hypothetical protein ABIU29_07630 [Chthoniobacterales bacterium]
MRLRFRLAWLACHLSLIVLFSLRDLLTVLPASNFSFVPSFTPFLQSAGSVISAGLGEGLSLRNPWRQILASYGNLSGIENGSSYFAPSVPPNCKLLFELRYKDRSSEYDLPRVRGEAAGYRVATLLDYLLLFHSAALQKAILRPLVYECWKEHPEAKSIRAIVALADLPTLQEFKSGTPKTYEFVYSYEFSFQVEPVEPASP